MKILAILTVRNEAAFLLEWVAHHRACGITDFLVFSNDCQDGTDVMLDRLQELGIVEHVRNDGPHDDRGIQFTALNTAAQHPLTKSAEWILPIDVDEFVNVHVGARTLPDLIAALSDATAITLTWRLFGNNDVVEYDDQPVTETFTRAAPLDMPWPWRSAMFKTLYRNDGTYAKPGVHRPRSPDKSRLGDARWYDGEGRELDDQFKTRRIFSNYGKSNHRLAQINHYPLGAMESYVLKADRGRAVHSDHLLDIDYWVERNFNTEEDKSILALSPQRAAFLQEMYKDTTLAALHAAAVAWRQNRYRELMREEPFRALFGRLMMTPPSRPVTREAARKLWHYGMQGRAQSGETG